MNRLSMLPEIVTPIPGPRSRDLASSLSKYENRNVTYLAEASPYSGREPQAQMSGMSTVTAFWI